MPLLPMYKRKQGKVVRWITFLTLAALWIFGAYSCFIGFPEWKWAETVYLYGTTIPLVDISTPDITPQFLISVGIGVLLIFFSAYLCFWGNKTSDFLIETESEMKKVSWPTIKDVMKSSVVVIIVIIILALYLFATDVGLDFILHRFLF